MIDNRPRLFELPNPIQRSKDASADNSALDPKKRRAQVKSGCFTTRSYNKPAPKKTPLTIVLLDGVAFFQMLNEL